jgi:hypothetical protein
MAAKWDVEFYEKSNGRCPTKEFLTGISGRPPLYRSSDGPFRRARSGFGSTARRFLRDHIHELRVRTESWPLPPVVLFFDGRKFIITQGIVKKTAKVPITKLKEPLSIAETISPGRKESDCYGS